MTSKILKDTHDIQEKLDNTIQPFHGYITRPLSRAAFLISRGLLGAGWPANEMEGGKNFPNYTGGQFARQGNEGSFYSDVSSAVPPADGLIISGGHTTNNRLIVNYTDSELANLMGIQGGWPKLSVTSGSTFYATWAYQAPHKTRGYRWYITKQDWDTSERPTRGSFELEPLYSDFNSETPYWSYSAETMAPWNDLSVVLPSRTGHQILLCAWIIADTGMAFYQAFDLNFESTGSSSDNEESRIRAEEARHSPSERDYPACWSPNNVQYSIGDHVIFHCHVYICIQAHRSNSGWSPEIAVTLWQQVN